MAPRARSWRRSSGEGGAHEGGVLRRRGAQEGERGKKEGRGRAVIMMTSAVAG
jgi:hypothetical protein